MMMMTVMTTTMTMTMIIIITDDGHHHHRHHNHDRSSQSPSPSPSPSPSSSYSSSSSYTLSSSSVRFLEISRDFSRFSPDFAFGRILQISPDFSADSRFLHGSPQKSLRSMFSAEIRKSAEILYKLSKSGEDSKKIHEDSIQHYRASDGNVFGSNYVAWKNEKVNKNDR